MRSPCHPDRWPAVTLCDEPIAALDMTVQAAVPLRSFRFLNSRLRRVNRLSMIIFGILRDRATDGFSFEPEQCQSVNVARTSLAW